MTTSWVTLPTVRSELGFTADTSNDAALQRKIDAACALIETIKGRIGQEVVTGDTYTIGQGGVVIIDSANTPIISVQAVRTVAPDGTQTVIDQRQPAFGVMTGWELQSLGGVLRVPGRIGTDVLIDYTTGRDPVPPNYSEAAVVLACHLWRQEHDNDEGGRMGAGGDDENWPSHTSAGIGAYALPFRVRELLGLFGSAVKSQVLVR